MGVGNPRLLWSFLIKVTASQHPLAKGPEGRRTVLFWSVWNLWNVKAVDLPWGVLHFWSDYCPNRHGRLVRIWRSHRNAQAWSALDQDHCRESAQRSTGDLDALPSCEKDASRQHVTIQAGHDFQFWHLSILSFCCVVEHSRFVMMHLIHGHLSSLCWQHAIFQKMATKWPIFFTWYNMYIVSFSSFYRYPPESKGRGGHVWYSGFCMVPCSWWCWSQGAWLGRCHA